MKTEKIIRQYLLLTGVFNFGVSLTLGTYVTFLLSRGLNLLEINLVNVAYFTAMFFCEIPTGAFADAFGRKKSYVLSCFIFALGELVYGLSQGMAMFIVAEIVAGIGRTFANGAYHAWLVDTLHHHGYDGDTAELFKREYTWRQVVGIPGALIGSWIASFDLSYPWLVGSVIGAVSGAVAACTMKEEYFVEQAATVRQRFAAMIDIAKAGVAFARKSEAVKLVIFMSMTLAFSVQALNMQWQPFFKDAVGGTTGNGFVWAGIALLTLAGIKLSVRLRRRVGAKDVALLVLMSVTGVLVVGSSATKGWSALSLALFLLHEFSRGAFGPIKDGLLNDAINPRERATVISCQSMFIHAACLSGLFLSGLAAKQWSIQVAWLLSGLVLTLVPLAVMVQRKRA